MHCERRRRSKNRKIRTGRSALLHLGGVLEYIQSQKFRIWVYFHGQLFFTDQHIQTFYSDDHDFSNGSCWITSSNKKWALEFPCLIVFSTQEIPKLASIPAPKQNRVLLNGHDKQWSVLKLLVQHYQIAFCLFCFLDIVFERLWTPVQL